MKYIFLFIFIFMSNANAEKNVLLIQSSLSGDISVTNKIGYKLLDKITKTKKYQKINVKLRDLNKMPVANISSDSIIAFYTPLEKQDDKIKKILEPSNLLAQEVLSADIIIVCAPMYNFGIPASLKAWIDNIVRPGLTFKYTNKGVEGLISDQTKVIIVTSSGGSYSSVEGQKMDFVSPYLKTIFGFMGVKNIEIISNEYSSSGEIKTFKSEDIKVGELSKDAMKYYHQISDDKAISKKINDIIISL